MCQGMHSRSIFYSLLLIATAIQAITPDPQDLASVNALRLLCSGSLVLPGFTDDELPDEVSGPVESGLDIVFRRVKESLDSQQSVHSPTSRNAPDIQPQSLRATTTICSFAQPACALENLCKRNC